MAKKKRKRSGAPTGRRRKRDRLDIAADHYGGIVADIMQSAIARMRTAVEAGEAGLARGEVDAYGWAAGEDGELAGKWLFLMLDATAAGNARAAAVAAWGACLTLGMTTDREREALWAERMKSIQGGARRLGGPEALEQRRTLARRLAETLRAESPGRLRSNRAAAAAIAEHPDWKAQNYPTSREQIARYLGKARDT